MRRGLAKRAQLALRDCAARVRGVVWQPVLIVGLRDEPRIGGISEADLRGEGRDETRGLRKARSTSDEIRQALPAERPALKPKPRWKNRRGLRKCPTLDPRDGMGAVRARGKGADREQACPKCENWSHTTCGRIMHKEPCTLCYTRPMATHL